MAAGEDLRPEAIAQVWAHLRECEACRLELGALRRARAVLQETGDQDRRDGTCAFFAALERDVVAVARQPALPTERTWVPGVASAAAIASVLVGLWAVQPRESPIPRPLKSSPWHTVPARHQVEGELVPLFYSQGLEAQTRLQQVFETDPEPRTWPEPRVRRSSGSANERR